MVGSRAMARPSYTTSEGRATRDQILQAALRVFGARGYRGAAIDTIAADAGVSRAGLLHHFPSKAKLLVAVLDRRAREDTRLATEMFALHHGSLIETLRGMRSYMAERRGLANLYTILSAESVDPDHPAHEYFVEHYRRARTVMTNWIANEQTHGRLTDAIAPEQLASLALAVMDGLRLQEQLEQDAVEVDQTLAGLLKLLIT